mmetsp:Transcript_41519/g.62947  ORF Transcript_41519/g.62947 Transcript_41519/m.62947 type:complete len:122 (+) Transcript_41519:293-658(+)
MCNLRISFKKGFSASIRTISSKVYRKVTLDQKQHLYIIQYYVFPLCVCAYLSPIFFSFLISICVTLKSDKFMHSNAPPPTKMFEYNWYSTTLKEGRKKITIAIYRIIMQYYIQQMQVAHTL